MDLQSGGLKFMTIEEVSRGYVYRSIAKKWAASSQKLWYEFKDPLKTKDEIMDSVPVGITRDQWISFVNYRYKKETQPSDAASGPISPTDARRSRGASNPSDH
ncbi:uncharacterized protein LOC107819867 [Nicotiana tabacum]|uniref:Uncharacterized protein n=8 Tax=Nicotiana TaxID=4085 RepID=A0A1S4CJW3_TOBAC|nr:PREDICTED: uncharacterized protein LOC104237340 [Nicotiana sylvestris]XP_009789775.1 PREDICTED: uncharacterized protein LOC104237340 [Nicotiana sylvestris]XP_009789776.1 PREDICTED: uncharacterized protein LOC104237340 [Nicotiana sylvestris]XP_009789777.1 PREDICTED: uncharacterized protein LOC104237340 [Nicotiana sylvestris]XP_009789778.1 PREDICTED: uncharacterized protein LOC104237340 [Nicotiana sylvestris]XP_009789779.1 PREDICTED: uncharacterized protein LOC104237340 [Nicotiana sylvestris]